MIGRTIGLAAVVAVVPAALAIILADRFPGGLSNALNVGAVTLVFGGLLGGVLKLLLDDVVTKRRTREDAATFVAKVLGDLKAVYDRVARARILIPAHQSALTYGSEMRDLIEARVQLRNVVRALEGRAEGLGDSERAKVVGHVKSMEDYLQGLTYEFRDRYKPVADNQRAYEARVEARVKQLAENEQAGGAAIPNTPWELLASFPILNDLIGNGTQYRATFEKPLDWASEVLRDEMARIIGR